MQFSLVLLNVYHLIKVKKNHYLKKLDPWNILCFKSLENEVNLHI